MYSSSLALFEPRSCRSEYGDRLLSRDLLSLNLPPCSGDIDLELLERFLSGRSTEVPSYIGSDVVAFSTFPSRISPSSELAGEAILSAVLGRRPLPCGGKVVLAKAQNGSISM